MIFCNKCGNEIPNEFGFCTECGAAVPATPKSELLPTMRVNVGYGGLAAAPAREATLPSSPPVPHSEPVLNTPSAPPAGANVKPIMIVIGGIALALIVAAILITNSGSKSSNSATASTSSPSSLADSLQNAMDRGRLVTLTNDDAYTYYFQLKQSDPQNPKLSSIKSQLLPQLRSMGDDVIRQDASTQWHRLTNNDWTTAQRVYELAHTLEPNDRSLEARWKYAEGSIARLQSDRDGEERGYAAAAQLESNWALPHFRLGLLYMRRDRTDPNDRKGMVRGQSAVPHFKRAIELDPNWELPYLSMGTAYFLQNDLDTAERYYREAMGMNPNWGGPHAWLGAIYEKRGQCHDAISEYEKGLELVSNDDSFDVAGTQSKLDAIRSRCF
jgi:tetratricopeptide (TPR) repeat protein